jgi:hypothetical protein
MAPSKNIKIGPQKSPPPETAPAGMKIAPTDGKGTPTIPVPGK